MDKQTNTANPGSFSLAQKLAVIDLLWDCMKRDPEHKDRRKTGWGTKTADGIVMCIERIAKGQSLPPITEGKSLCPICGERITITGTTKDDRLIGSCQDAFTLSQWID